jgi:hypothetical protein
MQYKTRMILVMLRTRIAGSNSAQGMDVGLVRVFVYYMGLGRGRSPVQESDRLNYCFLLIRNSHSEPEKEPNLLNTQRKKKNKC